MKEIVRIKFGSHLYGTNTEKSDLDLKCVFIPPFRDIILQKIQESFHIGPEKKSEGEKNSPGDVDLEGFALHKYLRLLSEGQTVSLDMLFAPDWAILNKSEEWDLIRKNRNAFLCSKSASFVGYCRTQANKYGIKGSRVFAARRMVEFLSEMARKYSRKEILFDIPEDVGKFLAEGISHISKIDILQKSTQKFLPHIECCNRKMPYFASISECLSVYERVLNEYGERAKLAELNKGIDWKALSHAIRVGREALELLNFENITFPRPEKERLLKIKLGEIPYYEVAEEIELLLEEVERAESISSLNKEPDKELINNIVFAAYSQPS